MHPYELRVHVHIQLILLARMSWLACFNEKVKASILQLIYQSLHIIASMLQCFGVANIS